MAAPASSLPPRGDEESTAPASDPRAGDREGHVEKKGLGGGHTQGPPKAGGAPEPTPQHPPGMGWSRTQVDGSCCREGMGGTGFLKSCPPPKKGSVTPPQDPPRTRHRGWTHRHHLAEFNGGSRSYKSHPTAHSTHPPSPKQHTEGKGGGHRDPPPQRVPPPSPGSNTEAQQKHTARAWPCSSRGHGEGLGAPGGGHWGHGARGWDPAGCEGTGVMEPGGKGDPKTSPEGWAGDSEGRGGTHGTRGAHPLDRGGTHGTGGGAHYWVLSKQDHSSHPKKGLTGTGGCTHPPWGRR